MIAAGLILAALLLVAVLLLPTRPSLGEEERALRDYLRRKDAAEARGERWPE